MSDTWRTDPSVVALDEGSRGSGANRGEVGLGDFIAGTYPACSRHGAMNRVGREPSIWRCLAEGCNAGAIYRGEGTA